MILNYWYCKVHTCGSTCVLGLTQKLMGFMIIIKVYIEAHVDGLHTYAGYCECCVGWCLIC